MKPDYARLFKSLEEILNNAPERSGNWHLMVIVQQMNAITELMASNESVTHETTKEVLGCILKMAISSSALLGDLLQGREDFLESAVTAVLIAEQNKKGGKLGH